MSAQNLPIQQGKCYSSAPIKAKKVPKIKGQDIFWYKMPFLKKNLVLALFEVEVNI